MSVGNVCCFLYLGSTLGDTLQKDDVSKFIKVKQELAAKEKMPKYSTTPYDQAVKDEHKQKDILLTVDPTSQKKRRHDDKDQDPPVGSDQGMKKRRTGKDVEPSKKSSKSKDFAKVQMDVEDLNLDNVSNNADKPQADAIPKKDCKMIQAEKPPLTFDEFMSTPIDFSTFSMNRLKLNKITRADLVGLVFNLLKGSCKSCIELEYNIEECYRSLTDQLDWTNLEGHKSSIDMSKPLPLQDKEGRLTIPVEFFFNNDLKYLKKGCSERRYYSSITKSPAARYTLEGIEDMIPTLAMINRVSKHKVFSTMRILSVVSVKIKKISGYGYLEEIIVRVEDVQLGVESYQRKLNLTKPQRTYPHISVKEPYTLNFDPPGVIYEDKSKKKRLMRIDEIYKFCDETLHLFVTSFVKGY
ncbi:hypothetical protein Tco_1531175 [Tanacetum coccineum]